MSFYEELSDYYEGVFPASDAKISFIESNAVKEGLTLDVACGIGTDAIELTKSGFNIEGIDLEKNMIDRAIEKAKVEDIKVSFKECSMLDLEDEYSNNSISNVLCTGNSLVHLDNMAEIESVIYSAYNILEDGGKIIIQIINFDRIIDKNIKELPTIHNEADNIKFVRNYDFDESNGKINFRTKLLARGKEFDNVIPLLPLRKDELDNSLKEAGFKEMNYYGSFKGEAYNNDSYATIVVATK